MNQNAGKELFTMPQLPSIPEVKRMWGRFLHAGAMVMALAASAVFVWMGLTQAGLAGTHGTFTVEECHSVTHRHSGKHGSGGSTTDYTCTGAFRSDDGKAAESESHMSNLGKSYPKGYHFSTQLSGNEVMPRNTQAGAVKFIIASGILLLDAFVLFWFITRLDKNGLTMKETWRSTKGTAGRVAVVCVATVAVAGLLGSSVWALVAAG
ncbi:hypothetical protein [Streptomyces sp. NPDC093589]|uniref:hypothetical protein n=1 Tax=Streptomyces sp. NPDC093589 TaxID=3366043 RepID=UPI003808DE8B